MNFQNVNDVLKAAEKQHKLYVKRMSKHEWFNASESQAPKLPMRLRKKTADFVASNLWFSPVSMKATSYDWYLLLSKINGKIVLNEYNYSNATSKHVRKLKEVLDKLGIKPDLTIEAPKGLQNLQAAIEGYEFDNKRLIAEIENPRSKKETNKRRIKQVKANLKTIAAIKELL